MKRWISGLLAAVLLLAYGPALAQAAAGMQDYQIVESMKTRENEPERSLADNLGFVMELLQNEDVRSLFQIQDVKNLINEGILKILLWMVQNRPVTMKILTELEIEESDRRCVGTIWDSVDRVAETWREYSTSEDGRQMLAEMDAFMHDPDIGESVINFWELISSDDVFALLDAISSALTDEPAAEEEPVPDDTLEAQLDRSTFTGSLILELVRRVKESDWVQTSVPALLENDNLKVLLIHLSLPNDMTDVIREECMALINDPEVTAFFSQTAQAALDLLHLIQNDPDEPVQTEEINTVSEEAAP